MRDYGQLVRRVDAASQGAAQRIGCFGSQERDYSLLLVRLGNGPQGVMIAAGIHGDEPAGVEAAVRFIDMAVGDEALLSRFSFTVFPCNNPTGWQLGTRGNADGVDLNREFGSRSAPAEVRIIERALQGLCFDLVFEMHEDVDSPGFYLYELLEDHDLNVGDRIVQVVESMGCAINRARKIEGMSARGGVIWRRSIRFRKTRLPQAIYAYRTCGGHVITMEPPASVLPLEDRVKIELAGLDMALRALAPRER